jgi:hypothetical protein
MMKDLDFDELDQAVNSLMTGFPKVPAPQDDKEAEKTLTITPTLSDNERPSFATLEQTASKAGSEIESVETSASTLAPANPLAARRTGGRFMDVVHPSSDMKINDRPVVSREGLQLSPIAPRPAVATPQPAREPEVVASPEQASEVMEQKSEMSAWPDPIDMAAAVPADVPEVTTVVEEAAPVIPAIATTPGEIDEPAPLQTPFLADTKVEKRPLGAFAVDQVAADNMQEVSETAIDSAAEEVVSAGSFSTTGQEATPDLPDELQHDLIKIESDNETEVSSSETETPQKEHGSERIAPALSFAAPIVTPAPVAASGPASIQPQYKEEPSSTKEEHAAIYDTDTYHKPLAHPAKKKSGWLWVLWIILLLALGAGGAAALYYFKII